MRMKKMGIRFRLGQLKTWENRLSSYVAIINFAMIFYLYILETPFGLEWYQWLALISVAIVLIIFIDIKFVFPGVLDYTFKKNPEWKRMMRNQKKIMEKLGLEYEK